MRFCLKQKDILIYLSSDSSEYKNNTWSLIACLIYSKWLYVLNCLREEKLALHFFILQPIDQVSNRTIATIFLLWQRCASLHTFFMSVVTLHNGTKYTIHTALLHLKAVFFLIESKNAKEVRLKLYAKHRNEINNGQMTYLISHCHSIPKITFRRCHSSTTRIKHWFRCTRYAATSITLRIYWYIKNDIHWHCQGGSQTVTNIPEQQAIAIVTRCQSAGWEQFWSIGDV